MNAKKAKLLRRLAKEASLNQETVTTETTYVELENRRKKMDLVEQTESGDFITVNRVVSQGQLLVSPSSEKGIYKQFKNALKGNKSDL